MQLQEGDSVIVLLPTRSEKMLAKRRGPYKVLRKIGRVNYEIEVTLDEEKTRKQNFHIKNYAEEMAPTY